MKKYLRLYLYNLASLWLVTHIIPGVKIGGGVKALASASFALSLADLIVKPLINLLLLPINLLTLGAFRWVANVAALYLVTMITPQLEISGFKFLGFSYDGLIITPFYISKFWALVLASFIISFTTSFLLWLRK